MISLQTEILPILQKAVLKAGHHLLDAGRNKSEITTHIKPDKSLVLNLDIESQQILRQVLGNTLPIVSEEDETSHHLIGSLDPYIIIDPIDGTTSCKRFLGQFELQVGFGPLVGYVDNGLVMAACFFNVPQRAIYYAIRDEGCYEISLSSYDIAKESVFDLPQTQLIVSDSVPLGEGAVLFYAGDDGEIPFVEKLKRLGVVENFYRFGGFANDCSRLARGLEQMQIQFSVKGWDLPAVLFLSEAGLSVIMDPKLTKTSFSYWKVRSNNPMIAAPKSLVAQVLEYLD